MAAGSDDRPYLRNADKKDDRWAGP